MVASASPRWIAAARAAIAPPKRYTRRSTTIPSCSGELIGLVGRRADDVAEHRPGLHRGELVGVADEDEAGVGSHRLDELGHQRQRHHRGLVDDDDVVGQPVVAVVAEAAAVARLASEQAVQRRRRQCRQASPHRLVDGHRRRLGAHRLLEPGGRLGRRRGEGDSAAVAAQPCAACSSSRARMRATVVVLPVPGSAGDDGQPASARRAAAAARWRSGSGPPK